MAASLQLATERVAYSVIKPYIEKYKPTNICFSGGVILNSVMMGKMYDWFGIKNMYVCPVPYDGGLAIGSAQYVWHQILNNPRINILVSANDPGSVSIQSYPISGQEICASQSLYPGLT